jgi:hypothetical protein
LEDRSLPSSVQGTIFNDANRNNVADPGELGVPGWTVFVDNNRDGIMNPGEASGVTDANGQYLIDTSAVIPNNGNNFFRLDLQVGSGGRWLNSTRLDVWANPTTEPDAVRDFGVFFQPYVGVQPDGPEALVNTTTAEAQEIGAGQQSIAADAAGNYVVTWRSPATPTTQTVFARRFAADGTPLSGEINVSTVDSTVFGMPEVAMSSNGRFAVAWPQNGTNSTLMRVYDAAGMPITSTISVFPATGTTSGKFTGIAMDDAGDIAVLYHVFKNGLSKSLEVQRFTPAGAANGDAIKVTPYTVVAGRHAITMDATGRFIVAWDDWSTDANGVLILDVYAQRFSASGQKVGSQITVDSAPNPGVYLSNASMNAAGRFVVTSVAYASDPLTAHVYDWGTPVGGPIVLNRPGDRAIWDSTSDVDSQGNVTVAWVRGYNPSSGTTVADIHFRRITADGTLEPELLANSTTQGTQDNPALAATGNGTFVVAWHGNGPGDDQGIFAQRFTGTPPPPPPTTFFSIDDVTVTEGNAGTTSANFTVTLSAASSDTVSVQFLTANDTAQSGSDFQSTGGTLTFAPGETSQTISVPIMGDRIGEGMERYFVNLSNAMNAGITDGQGVGTIVDDESVLTINDVAHNEGAQNTTTAFTFTVTLSAAYDQAVTLSYHTTNGTATTGNDDYVAKTGSLTFNPGETQKTIAITVNGDKKRESDETFNVVLDNVSSNALLSDGLGLGTILNDD